MSSNTLPPPSDNLTYPAATVLHGKESTTSAFTWQWLVDDARHFQIVVLTGLLTLGQFFFHFDIPSINIITALGAALFTQGVCTAFLRHVKNIPIAFDPRSPIISGLSLSLLLKTGHPELMAGAAVVAMASKFIVRVKGKHVFNPANLGIVAAILISPDAWVSPGQWGNLLWIALLLTCAAGVVLSRTDSSDSSLFFLASYAALLFGSALWLGDPWSIPMHQLQSGTILLFAFFMISDPKTLPNSRKGRFIFTAAVATIAIYIQYALYNPSGLMLALTLSMALVPIIDKVFPAPFQHGWVKNRHQSNFKTTSTRL